MKNPTVLCNLKKTKTADDGFPIKKADVQAPIFVDLKKSSFKKEQVFPKRTNSSQELPKASQEIQKKVRIKFFISLSSFRGKNLINSLIFQIF